MFFAGKEPAQRIVPRVQAQTRALIESAVSRSDRVLVQVFICRFVLAIEVPLEEQSWHCANLPHSCSAYIPSFGTYARPGALNADSVLRPFAFCISNHWADCKVWPTCIGSRLIEVSTDRKRTPSQVPHFSGMKDQRPKWRS